MENNSPKAEPSPLSSRLRVRAFCDRRRQADGGLGVIGKNGENTGLLAATDDGCVGLFFRDAKFKMRFMTLMTPAGDLTMSFADAALKNRLEVGAIPDDAGMEYSLRLLCSDGSEAWKPPVRNEVLRPRLAKPATGPYPIHRR